MVGVSRWLEAPIFQRLTAAAQWIVNVPVRKPGAFGIALAWIGLVGTLVGFQKSMCGLSGLRPVCSVSHLGGVAAPEEQRLWDQVSKAQTCDGYRQYIGRYGGGEFVAVANARLAAARRTERISWEAEDKSLPIDVVAPLRGSASETAAQAVAIASGRQDAENLLCKPYSAGEFRLTGVDVRPISWDCSPRHGGVACGFDGQAICHVQTRTIDVSEDCSVMPKS